jgi:hypothetical protein
MGAGLVRLGGLTVRACRADRIVNFCESFGLGIGHRGPWAADWPQAISRIDRPGFFAVNKRTVGDLARNPGARRG